MSTLFLSRPLAYAVTTFFSLSISSTSDLVNFKTLANLGKVIVINGKISDFQPKYPEIGSTLSHTPNKIIRSIPNQKGGIDHNPIVRVTTEWSKKEFFL